MIVFALKCANGHGFEGWFRDGATYEVQEAAGEVACPHCGSNRVAKDVMAPRLNSARGEALEAKGMAREMRRMLLEVRRSVEQSCDYVGERFAEEGRRIHYGETEARGIYGDASADEAAALEDEGIAVARIPWLRADD